MTDKTTGQHLIDCAVQKRLAEVEKDAAPERHRKVWREKVSRLDARLRRATNIHIDSERKNGG